MYQHIREKVVSNTVGEYFYCVLTIDPTAVTLFIVPVLQGPTYLFRVQICLVLCKSIQGNCHESASVVR